MEKHFTYILYSPKLNLYYKGYSTDPHKRLLQHNNDEGRYTAGKGPWELVFVKSYPTKREALIAERKLKRCNPQYLQKLITGDENELNQ
ncbi:endonuclease [bacterium]|nr:endonuclease [bacterium]